MDILFRKHALMRMAQRAISDADVRNIIESGKTIEEYPNDTPYPSRLVLGWAEDRPLHAVIADAVEERKAIVITVYEPDPERWNADFTRRARK